ncbi:MAG TPA: hypothetical protein VD789_08730, partial [Thermomicrobiales bacterium]|nr:hypothetical protein [Thermomicrobiales bacterium]
GHPFLQGATHVSQSLALVRVLRPKRAILSHIEEEDDLGPDRFEELAARYQREGVPITFAHDTMRVTI